MNYYEQQPYGMNNTNNSNQMNTNYNNNYNNYNSQYEQDYQQNQPMDDPYGETIATEPMNDNQYEEATAYQDNENYVDEPVQEEPTQEDSVQQETENADTDANPIIKDFQPGKANILVCGVGGGGNNAVNNMIRKGITSANFVVMNTDVQALNMSLVPPEAKIQLGENKTGGLGAGSDPVIGRESAEESRDKIKQVLKGVNLLFITAGMGGGTGTGAAPVVAEIAKSMGILTVAVVTKPFNFEGIKRMRNAEEGIATLKNFVDTLLVIQNQKLIDVLNKNVSFKHAFEIADDVLNQAIKGVSDVIVNSSLINLDFADVKTILKNKGFAHMGIGTGKGAKRVVEAVKNAICSPLLETDIEGATGVILNITGGEDMLLSEVSEACDIVKQVLDPSANIIFGTGFEAGKKDIEITIIATGFKGKKGRLNQTFASAEAQQKDVGFGSIKGTPQPQEENKNENDESNKAEDLKFPERPSFNNGYQRNMGRDNREQNPVFANSPQERPSNNGSRIDVPQRKVPEFLSRLRNGRK